MRFAHKIILAVAMLAAAFLAGYMVRPSEPVASKNAARQPLYYHCPMHPEYKSGKPGDAPCCGMKLVPVYAEGAAEAGPETVRISMEKQQLMGLRTEKIRRSSGSHTIRVLGKVAPDETRVHRVTALLDGVVREVSAFSPGSAVKKGDVLARYFVSTPELYSAIQAYFVAMNAADQRAELNLNKTLVDASQAQIRLSEELLQTYGMNEDQLRELARTRRTTRDIEFHSPVTGLVLARNVSLGQRLERGAELFRIADMSRVWVLADIFEADSSMVQPGTAARVLYRGRTYRGSLRDARQFDPVSRTIKMRLELDNPGAMLRPDMFVDVETDVREPEGITVPADALLDTGRRKAVFVATGESSFAPREVTTGARYGDRIQVVQGLEEGESVVVSGLFLLDSESRLQLASSGAVKKTSAPAAHTDPVCGMEVEVTGSTLHSEMQGATYYFCSKPCKEKFGHNPGAYTQKRGGRS